MKSQTHSNDLQNSISPNSGNHLHRYCLFCGRVVHRCKTQKEMQELTEEQKRALTNRFDDLMADNIAAADAQRQQLSGHTQQITSMSADLKRDFEAGRITAEDFEKAMKLLAYSA